MENTSLICLPAEILGHIFQFLGTRDKVAISCTCVHLRRVSLDPSLWKTVKLSYLTSHGWKLLESLMKKNCTFIVNLYIHGLMSLTKIVGIVGRCCALQSLGLLIKAPQLTSPHIDALCNNLKNLKSLDVLVSVPPHEPVFSPKSLSAMSKLHHLALYMSHTHIPSQVDLLQCFDAWLKNRCRPQHVELHLSNQAPLSLSTLYMTWCTHIQMKSPMISCEGSGTFTLCLQCVRIGWQGSCKPTMQVTLNNGEESSSLHFKCVCQESLGMEMKSCMPVISYDGCHFANFVELVSIPNSFITTPHNLTHLDLSNITSLIPEQICHIAHSCPQLMVFCISGCFNALTHLCGLEVLVKCCQRLKYLGLSRISFSKINHIDFWKILSLTNLKSLTVSNCCFSCTSTAKTSASDSVFNNQDQLAVYCKKLSTLKGLELVCCNHYCDKSSCLPCSSISDSHLGLIQFFDHLTHLSITTTTSRGFPRAVSSIFSRCQLLQKFHLEYRSHHSGIGFGSITLPLPMRDVNVFGALTQLYLISSTYSIPDDLCASLGTIGKMTHLHLLVEHISMKSIEVLLKGNTKLISVAILMRKSHGKKFKEFIKHLTSNLNTCYAVLSGKCIVQDNCSRRNDRDLLLDMSSADFNSDLRPIWLSIM